MLLTKNEEIVLNFIYNYFYKDSLEFFNTELEPIVNEGIDMGRDMDLEFKNTLVEIYSCAHDFFGRFEPAYILGYVYYILCIESRDIQLINPLVVNIKSHLNRDVQWAIDIANGIFPLGKKLIEEWENLS